MKITGHIWIVVNRLYRFENLVNKASIFVKNIPVLVKLIGYSISYFSQKYRKSSFLLLV